MKFLIAALPAALLMIATPALVSAQAVGLKPGATTKVAPRPKATKPRLSASQQKALEEEKAVDEDPATKLTDADLAVAKQVITGDIPCELGATVHITPHKREGFFIVRAGIQRFRMHPVESRTGAIRLEDPVAGAMWLQLANKSMLMSQKIGKRLADDCMSSTQAALNETLKKNPINILAPAPVVKAPEPSAPDATAAPAAEMPAPAASAPGTN
ncbi:MAG: hypothetical protein NVSMB34_03850 [Variovorax sp.]